MFPPLEICTQIALKTYSKVKRDFPELRIWPSVEEINEGSARWTISLLFAPRENSGAIGKINIYSYPESSSSSDPKRNIRVRLESSGYYKPETSLDDLRIIAEEEGKKVGREPPSILFRTLHGFYRGIWKENWKIYELRFQEIYVELKDAGKWDELENTFEIISDTVLKDLHQFMEIFKRTCARSTSSPKSET